MHPVPVGETGGSKGQGTTEPVGDHPACTEALLKEGWGNRPGVPTNGRLYPCPARGAGPLSKSGTADGNDVVARVRGRAMSRERALDEGLGEAEAR